MLSIALLPNLDRLELMIVATVSLLIFNNRLPKSMKFPKGPVSPPAC